jgi:hypothetical protein
MIDPTANRQHHRRAAFGLMGLALEGKNLRPTGFASVNLC